jgi:aminoglycoside phosphotransferase (APT) family kinase protein
LAPRPLAIIEDEGVLGVPFFAMEKKAGRILRAKPPRDLELSPELMRALSASFVDALAALHGIDVEQAGLAGIGRPAGYVRRQVEGWRERYQRSKTDEISDMERLAAWLEENVPAEESPAPATMIHNDFKYDNLVLDPRDATIITGVLDWELATVGDPMTDLATSLAYWIEAEDDEALRMMPLGPTHLPGNLTRMEIVQRYEEKSGKEVRHLLFHVALASFKIAVIAQQIYFRYAKGFTSDPRFASLGFAVALIGARACRMLDAGTIEAR